MTSVRTLILDGIWGRPRRWEPLRAMIERRIGPAEIYRYDDSGRVPFESLGRQFCDAVRERADDNGVNVVGYSMGGLVIRSAHLLDPALPLRRAVFMNSPHRGSWLACLLPMPGVRQMRPFDPYMKRVREHRWEVPTLTIWNPIDGIIVPGHYTRFEGAGDHVRCAVPIHIWPVWSRQIRRRVVDFLSSEPDRTSADEMVETVGGVR